MCRRAARRCSGGNAWRRRFDCADTVGNSPHSPFGKGGSRRGRSPLCKRESRRVCMVHGRRPSSGTRCGPCTAASCRMRARSWIPPFSKGGQGGISHLRYGAPTPIGADGTTLRARARSGRLRGLRPRVARPFMAGHATKSSATMPRPASVLTRHVDAPL
jgi:hypothetical protein